MFSRKVLFILLTIVLCEIYSGSALKCYKCESGPIGQNSDCETLSGPVPSPCGANEVCVSYKLKETEAVTRIVRRCAIRTVCDAAPEKIDCKTCESDGCNSSNFLTSSVLTIIVTYFIIRIY